MGQIGNALGSRNLERIAEVTTWLLPFEALYQKGLYLLTSESSAFTTQLLSLGPLGGANPAGGGLWVWAVLFTAIVLGVAALSFARRDL